MRKEGSHKQEHTDINLTVDKGSSDVNKPSQSHQLVGICEL